MKVPGKIILFGEHAVVFDHPGIAIPVKKIWTDVSIRHSAQLKYITTDLNTEQHAKLKKVVDFILLSLELEPNFTFTIESNIPMSSGMGSSASLSVALIRSLSQHLDLTDKKINDIAYGCEKIFHGNPSGLDNTVVTYQKPIFFENGNFEEINTKNIDFVIASTDKKSDTSEVVKYVTDRYDRLKNIIDDIGKLTHQARKYIESSDKKNIGRLMDKNHRYLQKLGVSSPELDELVKIAKENGAYGAKMAGAGWGGNIVCIGDKEKISEALSKKAKVITTSL